MLYILASLVAATLYGLVTVAVYGHDALVNGASVDSVFWWLIGTGIALQILDGHLDLRCLWNRLTTLRVRTPCTVLNH